MIKKLHIDGFGQFQQKNIELEPGINIIYGANESGKTTIREFVIHMLFGLEKSRGIAARNDAYTVYMPVYGGTYGGSLELVINGKEYVVQRKFRKDEKEDICFQKETGQLIDITSLISMRIKNYIDSFAMKHDDLLPSKNLCAQLLDYASNIAESGTQQIQVNQAIMYLKEKRRELKREKNQKDVLLEEKRQRYLMVREDEEDEEVSSRGKLYFLVGFLCLVGSFFAHWLVIVTIVLTVMTFSDKLKLKEKERKQDKKEEIKIDLRREYQTLKENVIDLEYNIKQIDRAIEGIQEAAQEMSHQMTTPLNEKVSQMVSFMTDGKYQHVKIDESLSFMVEYKDRWIDIKYLSTGTVEQIYLAVRMAAGELLFPRQEVPILLDDVFGNFDEKRMMKGLECIRKFTDKQILLFTCKESVAHQLKYISQKTHLISLEEI